jgi:predicted  nucleic acid-binding Zn-ribbon protein
VVTPLSRILDPEHADDPVSERASMAERLTDAERAVEEVEAERATLAEQIFDREEELKRLKKLVGDFTDYALGDSRLVSREETKRHAAALLDAIRGGR